MHFPEIFPGGVGGNVPEPVVSASLTTYFLGSRLWFPALILVLPLALPSARGQHNFQPKASCTFTVPTGRHSLDGFGLTFFPTAATSCAKLGPIKAIMR